jgi:hypothetical protein
MKEHQLDPDDEALSAAARSLHEEWDSPTLWPQIAAAIEHDDGQATPPRRWRPMLAVPLARFAVAAAVLLAAAATTWMVARPVVSVPRSSDSNALLTDDAVAAIDRAESQYVRAIDELTRLTRPKLDMPDSPLVVNLRERLQTIDAAIDEYRKEIEANRFNAHLRQQLLWIYQEKRRTLEEVQETDRHAS